MISYHSPNGKEIYERALSELERLGTGLWVGFSFPWVAQIYAMAENGNGAYQNLYAFAHGFVSNNGFHLNGDFKKQGYSRFTYCPFTVEANGMYAEAIGEMLMQYHHSVLRLFPAIPNEWRGDCSFRGFMLDANTYVSASHKGDVIECEIMNTAEEKEMTVFVFGDEHHFTLKSGTNR